MISSANEMISSANEMISSANEMISSAYECFETNGAVVKVFQNFQSGVEILNPRLN